MIHLARAAALAALFGVPSVAAAQAPAAPSPAPSPTATPPRPEIGRVVTSDRRLEPIGTTTRPTFVIDRAAIERFGARTVAQALENVPGVDLFSYGAFGAQVNYGIRGTSSAQTLVLRDGIPIIAGSNGIVDLGSLSTIGIQRIEVVESGASTLYGTSATGGVINLITETSTRPYVRVSAGSYGNDDVAAEAGTQNLAVSFERHVAYDAYDYPAFRFSDGTVTPPGTRTNADAQQSAARFSYLAPLAAGWTARLSGGDEAIRAGVPGSLAFGLTPDARQGTARSDAQLDVTHSSGASALTFTLAGVAQRLAYADPGPQLGGEDDTYDSRTQASVRYSVAGARADLVTGLDLSRESAALSFAPSTPPAPPLAAAASQSAAYVQLGYRLGAATRLVAGVRGENDAPHGKVLAPSFGVGVGLGAARLTANVGESFRVPTLVDLYFPGFSNPDLVPERLVNYDATLAVPLGGGSASLGTFGRDGSNLIALDPTTFVPFNASRVSVNGLQLVLTSPAYRHLRATASVTNVYRALDTSSGLRLPNTPPVLATLGLERSFDGGPIAFGARVRVSGSIAGDGPQPNPNDAYTVADAYVRYRVAPAGILTLRVRNLGNERYVPIYGYPAPGRTVSVELSTR
jgi:vitamin B12 transporter